METFFNQARGLLAEQLNIEAETIAMETSFEGINADSIDIVEMIMALEDLYDIEFPEEDLDKYPTLGSLITILYAFLQREGKI